MTHEARKPSKSGLTGTRDQTILTSTCKCVNDRFYSLHRINCRQILHLNVPCQVQNFYITLQKPGLSKFSKIHFHEKSKHSTCVLFPGDFNKDVSSHSHPSSSEPHSPSCPMQLQTSDGSYSEAPGPGSCRDSRDLAELMGPHGAPVSTDLGSHRSSTRGGSSPSLTMA